LRAQPELGSFAALRRASLRRLRRLRMTIEVVFHPSLDLPPFARMTYPSR
jgi:hypothetical protein